MVLVVYGFPTKVSLHDSVFATFLVASYSHYSNYWSLEQTLSGTAFFRCKPCSLNGHGSTPQLPKL